MTRPHREATDLLTDLFRHPLDSGYADAARRREENGPGRPWQVRGGKAARAVALLLAGLLFTVAYQQVVSSKPGTNETRDNLAKEVADRRAETDQLAKNADGLRDEVSDARENALAQDPELARIKDLEARTGLGRVTGDGVVVTVSDAPAAVDPVTGSVDPENPGRVIDRDLQDLANALWGAGAEAVAINGQRLTAITTIRAAGEAILVDFKPVTRPYHLSAIGPDGIEKRLADSATGKRFKRFAETYRMQFDIEAKDGLTLPAGADPGLQYARPPSAPPSASPSGPSSGPPVGPPGPSGSPR